MSGGIRFGGITLGLVVLVACLGPSLVGTDPLALDLEHKLEAPSLAHPLGCDRLGRDVLARIAAGARVSVFVGVTTVSLTLTIGTLFGLLAGMSGGWIDVLLMRLVDILLAFPGILLAIALAAVLGPGLGNVVLALAAIGWTGFARLVRAEALALRDRPHVEAAIALGVGPIGIVTRHVLPLLAGRLAVQATFALAGAIVAEASLSFLGIGVRPPMPSWGGMLNEGRGILLVAPHLVIAPAGALFVTVLGINAFGDALGDRLGLTPSATTQRIGPGGAPRPPGS